MSTEEDSQAAGEAILSALANPKRMKSDAGEVEEHSIPDLIAAKKYIDGQLAASTKSLGLRFRQARLPSATGRNRAD